MNPGSTYKISPSVIPPSCEITAYLYLSVVYSRNPVFSASQFRVKTFKKV